MPNYGVWAPGEPQAHRPRHARARHPRRHPPQAALADPAGCEGEAAACASTRPSATSHRPGADSDINTPSRHKERVSKITGKLHASCRTPHRRVRQPPWPPSCSGRSLQNLMVNRHARSRAGQRWDSQCLGYPIARVLEVPQPLVSEIEGLHVRTGLLQGPQRPHAECRPGLGAVVFAGVRERDEELLGHRGLLVRHDVVVQGAAGAARGAQPGAENGGSDDRALVEQRDARDVPLPRLQGQAGRVRVTGADRGTTVGGGFGVRWAAGGRVGQGPAGGVGTSGR